jgi:hypothetical protein
MQVFRGVRESRAQPQIGGSRCWVAPPTLVCGGGTSDQQGQGDVNPEKVSEVAPPPSHCYTLPSAAMT